MNRRAPCAAGNGRKGRERLKIYREAIMEAFIRVGRSLSRSRPSCVLIRNMLGLSREIRESLLILTYKENQDCAKCLFNIEMLSRFPAYFIHSEYFLRRNIYYTIKNPVIIRQRESSRKWCFLKLAYAVVEILASSRTLAH